MKTCHAPLDSPRPTCMVNLRLFGFVLASVARHISVLLSQHSSTEQQRMGISQRLKQALAKHFRYPGQARKRGWQRTVLTTFTLNTNGTIINAHIEQGSGYTTLDHAALIQVASINARPSQELSFEIPVIYSLNGG